MKGVPRQRSTVGNLQEESGTVATVPATITEKKRA
jgi:hypothetical protein